jgi:serine protease
MKLCWPFTLPVLILTALLMTAAYRPTQAVLAASKAVAPGLQTSLSEAPTNQLTIKYKPNTNLSGSNAPASAKQMQRLSGSAGVALAYVRPMSGDAHVLRLPGRLPVAEVESMARRIGALPDVEYAEPDHLMFSTLTPNDASYSSQWHYFETHGINAPAAWDITTGSSSIRVAVLDSGITDHPDLDGRWLGGYDFIANLSTANDSNGRDSDPHDPGNWITSAEAASGFFTGCAVTNSTWHGTHVAGTIGAASNNDSGVAGINWVSPLVPVRVVGKCFGFISDIADGMRWAAGLAVSGVPANPHPAKVLNLSLSGPGLCSTTYQNAINAVNAAGSIIVVAAGNNGSDLRFNSYQPANCNGVITVAATDRGGDRALYSNFGPVVEISAPGGETFTSSPSPMPQNGVLSTLNTGTTTPITGTYGYYQGTSMAAPHVAGVLSLMVSLNPTLNFTQSLQILQSTARPFPGGSSCTTSTCGSGIVDAAAALNAVGVPPATATPTPTNTPSPTPTFTPTPTPTNTSTPTPTHTALPEATATSTPTNTPTPTPTNTTLPETTVTPPPTNTALPEATATPTPTKTATSTSTSTATSTYTTTPTPTLSATAMTTPSPTAIVTPDPIPPNHFVYLPVISA